MYEIINCFDDFNIDIRVLDLGCGTGNFEKFLQASQHKTSSIYAIDISDEMLQKAIHKVKKNDDTCVFLLADLNHNLPLKNINFDYVVIIHAMYALTNPSVALQEAHRLLHKDGKLIIANPKQGASILKLFFANIKGEPWFVKFWFWIKNIPLLVFNFYITFFAGKNQSFWSKSKWLTELKIAGFTNIQIKHTYRNEDYLIIAHPQVIEDHV